MDNRLRITGMFRLIDPLGNLVTDCEPLNLKRQALSVPKARDKALAHMRARAWRRLGRGAKIENVSLVIRPTKPPQRVLKKKSKNKKKRQMDLF